MSCDLSVIIPVWNSEKTLQQCVASVVSDIEQCGFSYEVILVNDGSTDTSNLIIDNLCFENPNIKQINQSNAGPSSARNAGLKSAVGEFISFNDSDDKWISGKTGRQIAYLKDNPDVSLVCAKYGSGRPGHTVSISYLREVFHNYFSPQTAVFRHSVIEENGFNCSMHYSEDMRFLLDVMRNNTCVYMNFLAGESISGKYAFGDSGLSSKLWSMELGELSNILYALRIKKISCGVFFIATLWSFIKYVRRCLLSFVRSIYKKVLS